jgi:very-short-patch-repair endonuclease
MPDTIEKSMFYGAKPPIFEKAKALRESMTCAEKLLWEKLRNKQLDGLKFRAQHPIDIFIADFYCHQLKLVIEVDGDIHNAQKEYDLGREAEMEAYGIKTIRFTNEQIENGLESVLTRIKSEINVRVEKLNNDDSHPVPLK